MSPAETDPAVRAQAAAWLARLRSEERTAADEAGFRVWLDEDAGHRRAFDLVNTAWEIAAGASVPEPAPAAPRRRRRLALAAVAAMVAVVVVGGAAAWQFWPAKTQSYATGVGEQTRVVLADGSVMVLDTSTAVAVSMRPRRRSVELLHGRAHFVVARDGLRPFAVGFGHREVVAVGTIFDVAHEGDRASVLLTHGKVVVESQTGRRMLAPGDRVSFHADSMVEDRPNLDNLTAWRSGRAVFENEPLKDAIAEMNRYSRRPIVVADPALGEMRVSGRYRTGDVRGFAVSVATLLSLSVETRPNRVVLARRPQAAAAD